MEVKNLVNRARKGDDDAFYELIQIHKSRLLKIALGYLHNEEEALEALQEVTFRAYLSLNKLKHAEYFSTWVIRIMLNYCHDQIRKRKRIAYPKYIDNLIVTKNDNQTLEIEEALLKIDARFREVIILKYYNDLKIKDIAEILERSESTIKTWLYKGLKALQVQLNKGGGLNV
ncbi:RNA polymerase subunit sigma-70 [Cytobacillus kochii]|uniref:RNA polymerase subunit sigma-70 n=1 Tax=Cytobacillus kochii TaxID=859143 RepID=A0A248TH10_9BACI|nr:RNA polymerase subunit sigma-70 [Cytobacillus kochii]